MSESLVEPTRRFIEEVTAALEEVSRGVAGGAARPTSGSDVALEAFNLVCGLVALDRRVSDDELWEVLGAFGPLLETRLAGATPPTCATPGSSRPSEASPTSPSAMFEVLLAADAEAGPRHARGYYAARRRARVRGRRHRPPHLRARAGRHRAVPRHAARRHRGDGGRRRPAGRRPPRPRRPPATATARHRADPPARPIDELLAELDDLVGLDGREARGEARHQPAPGAADPRGAGAARRSTRAAT